MTDFDDFAVPEREAIKVARSLGPSLAQLLRDSAQRILTDTDVTPAQLRQLGARALVLARRKGTITDLHVDERPVPVPSEGELLTAVTVKLLVASDPDDPFDEAHQLAEIGKRLASASLLPSKVDVERTRR